MQNLCVCVSVHVCEHNHVFLSLVWMSLACLEVVPLGKGKHPSSKSTANSTKGCVDSLKKKQKPFLGKWPCFKNEGNALGRQARSAISPPSVIDVLRRVVMEQEVKDPLQKSNKRGTALKMCFYRNAYSFERQ